VIFRLLGEKYHEKSFELRYKILYSYGHRRTTLRNERSLCRITQMPWIFCESAGCERS